MTLWSEPPPLPREDLGAAAAAAVVRRPWQMSGTHNYGRRLNNWWRAHKEDCLILLSFVMQPLKTSVATVSVELLFCKNSITSYSVVVCCAQKVRLWGFVNILLHFNSWPRCLKRDTLPHILKCITDITKLNSSQEIPHFCYSFLFFK